MQTEGKICGDRSMEYVKNEELNLDAEIAEAMKGGVSSHAPSAPRAAVDYSKYKVTKRVEVKPEPVDDHEHGQSSSTSTSASSVKQDHHQKDYAPVRPIGVPAPHLKKAIPQSVSLHADESMFKPRKERQKVFAGRVSGVRTFGSKASFFSI